MLLSERGRKHKDFGCSRLREVQSTLRVFLQRILGIMNKNIAVVEKRILELRRHAGMYKHTETLGQPDLQVSRICQLGVGGRAKQHKIHSSLLSVTGK